MIVFFDFEVFEYDWLMVGICPESREEKVIVNSKDDLEDFYNAHANDIWVGYNSRNYDQWILKGILCGFNPKELSDFLIVEGRKGFEYSKMLNRIPLYTYDTMSKFNSLKQLEAFMGNNIKETSVPFDIKRKLTDEELNETIKYCKHDVEQTIEVFLQRIDDFNAHMALITEFDLGLSSISKTQAQLAAMAIGCSKHEWNDEWEIEFVPTLRIKKYTDVLEWFSNPENYKDGKSNYIRYVCGVPHIFALGGLHGAIGKIKENKNGKKYVVAKHIHRKGLIVHVDVSSFYPSMMIRYGLLTRNATDPSKFKEIYDKRIALKKAGKKKEQAPYKIILNSTFGICNDKYSKAYDPRRAREVCINGQLLILDLLEHLEGHCEIIQSNTDGLIVRVKDDDDSWNTFDDICYEWEERTGVGLTFDFIKEIYQGDVNNYLWIGNDGSTEYKGAYVKEKNPLDNDMPIVNKAIVERLVNKTPIRETIENCDDLIEFQKIFKVTNKYKCAWHNGERLQEKTYRVFASKRISDTYLGKIKDKEFLDRESGEKKIRESIEKFANSPEHCFIINDAVADVKVGRLPLDKEWYIQLARNRIKDKFGIASQ